MNMAIQSPSESFANTAICAHTEFGYSQARQSKRQVFYISGVDAQADAPVAGASDIDAFIDELASVDPSFNTNLKSARKRLNSHLHKGVVSLKSLRLQRGFSQAELAKAIGTSQPHVARMEKFPERMMLTTSLKLATALGVDITLIASLAAGTKIEGRK